LLCLVIFSENRDVKARFIEIENLRDEFQRFFYRIFLEVVAEREKSKKVLQTLSIVQFSIFSPLKKQNARF